MIKNSDTILNRGFGLAYATPFSTKLRKPRSTKRRVWFASVILSTQLGFIFTNSAFAAEETSQVEDDSGFTIGIQYGAYAGSGDGSAPDQLYGLTLGYRINNARGIEVGYRTEHRAGNHYFITSAFYIDPNQDELPGNNRIVLKAGLSYNSIPGGGRGQTGLGSRLAGGYGYHSGSGFVFELTPEFVFQSSDSYVGVSTYFGYRF